MHLIRRAAFRAAGSASFASAAPRSITTTSPFLARSKIQSAVSQSVFRRFASDDARPIEAADGEQGAVQSAIDSAEEPFQQRSRSFEDRPRERRAFGDRGGAATAPLTPTSGIYVGNLLFDITAADLEKEFSPFGTVKSVRIVTDANGTSKGFGYVEFESVDIAKQAIEAKNMSVFEGRRIVVNYMANTRRREPTTHEPQNAPSKTLFIGNLAFEMSDADLNRMFRDIRNVLDVRVAIDRRTGQPRGFAHADFVDVESAVAARETLAGKEIYGRKIRIDYSAGRERTRPAF